MDYQEFLPILEQYVVEKFGRTHPYYRDWSYYYHTRGNRMECLIKSIKQQLPFPIEQALTLDIGCGTGSATVELSRLGTRVIGIDMDEDFGLNLARIRTHDEQVLGLLQSDALKLPFPNNSIDFCFSFNAIEHFTDFQHAITEMHRVTRPGGVVYVETANKNWPWEAHTQLLFAGWLPHSIAEVYVKLLRKRRWNDPWDVHPLSYQRLSQTLEHAGFTIIADFVELTSYNTSPVAQLVRQVSKWKLPVQWFMPNVKLLAMKLE